MFLTFLLCGTFILCLSYLFNFWSVLPNPARPLFSATRRECARASLMSCIDKAMRMLGIITIHTADACRWIAHDCNKMRQARSSLYIHSRWQGQVQGLETDDEFTIPQLNQQDQRQREEALNGLKSGRFKAAKKAGVPTLMNSKIDWLQPGGSNCNWCCCARIGHQGCCLGLGSRKNLWLNDWAAEPLSSSARIG